MGNETIWNFDIDSYVVVREFLITTITFSDINLIFNLLP